MNLKKMMAMLLETMASLHLNSWSCVSLEKKLKAAIIIVIRSDKANKTDDPDHNDINAIELIYYSFH